MVEANEEEAQLPHHEGISSSSFGHKGIIQTILASDFNLKLLTRKQLYLTSRHIFLLFLEIAIIAGFGLAYLYAVSYIPFTRLPFSVNYYNPVYVSLLYFGALFTTVLVIGYGFWPMIYGFKKSISLIYWTILPGVAVASVFFIVNAAGYQPWFYGLDFCWYVAIGVIFVNSARVIQREVKLPGVIKAYSIPLLIHVVVIATYTFGIVPAYRYYKNYYVRILFRLVIHPIVTNINLLFAESFCMKYEGLKFPHLASGVVFGVWVESAMLGRLLLTSIGTLEYVSLTAMLVGLVEIIKRCTTLRRERAVALLLHTIQKKFKIVQKILGPPEELLKDPTADPKELLFFAQFTNNVMVVEKVSIVVVPFMIVLFYPQRLVLNFTYQAGVIPDEVFLLKVAAIQFGIQLFVDFVCINVECLQGVPMLASWRLMRVNYIIWEVANYIQILTLILYIFRSLPFAYFCSSPSPCSCGGKFIDLSLFVEAGIC